MIFQVLLMPLKAGGDSLDQTAASNVFLIVLFLYPYMCQLSSVINLYFDFHSVLFFWFRIHHGIQMLRSKQ